MRERWPKTMEQWPNLIIKMMSTLPCLAHNVQQCVLNRRDRLRADRPGPAPKAHKGTRGSRQGTWSKIGHRCDAQVQMVKTALSFFFCLFVWEGAVWDTL